MANLDNYDNDTFYLAFKDVHPSWSLIGSNYLLALCSFFELVHQQGQFLFVYTAFSGQNFMECRLAAKILFIPLIGLGGINPTMFFTGIDRLIGIVFSEFHDTPKKRLYLALLTILSVSYGFYMSISVYQNAIVDGLPSADSINRRIFRALFCIITVNVGGYLFTAISNLLLSPFISSPITAWFFNAITGIPLTIAASSNGPILYFTSTEYRQAFKTAFPFVFNRISNPNRVISLQTGSQLGTTQY
ncbi:hypothetical protein niasHT_015163 [Heterodera trifolii]|uniref:G protein-coupled receptor n=1 Tax=Heterodera trifolii TaxID=157864 RepID=A0ABD2L9Q5_9BILA